MLHNSDRALPESESPFVMRGLLNTLHSGLDLFNNLNAAFENFLSQLKSMNIKEDITFGLVDLNTRQYGCHIVQKDSLSAYL